MTEDKRHYRRPCVMCTVGVAHRACRLAALPGRPEFKESDVPPKRGHEKKSYKGNGFGGTAPPPDEEIGNTKFILQNPGSQRT